MSVPIRRILTEADMAIFKESQTKKDILGFIVDLNESVKGCTNDDKCLQSPVVQQLVEILEQITGFVDQFPATDQVTSRFGKPEFREFYDHVQTHAKELLLSIPSMPHEHVEELAVYFCESWGNRSRIDYGSGHELNFVTVLLCLNKLGLLKPEDYKATVLKVFISYVKTMRYIQTMYWLEPAGSHGVWGLDDYHFLPFLFGSSQLAPHKYLRPSSIHDSEIVEMYHEKYLYFGCVWFINSVKTASLRWNSPLIDDISGVKRWAKVNEGMIKMYDAEVLGKLPIMQHFMFGSLVTAPDGLSPPPESGTEQPHVHNGWADCCGIAVPSAIAASKKQHTQQLRRVIPFD